MASVSDQRIAGRVYTFGRFQVLDESGAPMLPKSRKAIALFAYLLTRRGAPISRETAVDFFWSDRANEQGRASLRQALLEIRRAIPKQNAHAIVFERNALGIRSEAFSFDFDGTFTSKNMHDVGEFLQGIDPAAPVFDEWLETERRGLRSQQVALLEQHFSEGTSPELVVQAAETLLTLEPENEYAAQYAIRAYGSMNKHYKAKEIRNRIHRTLAEDGITLSRETEATFSSAMAAESNASLFSKGPPVLALLPIKSQGTLRPEDVSFFNSLLIARLGDVREFSCVVCTTAPGDDSGEWSGPKEADFVVRGYWVRTWKFAFQREPVICLGPTASRLCSGTNQF